MPKKKTPEGGKPFVITAPAATLEKGGEDLVKGVRLNGRKIPADRISHKDMVKGGELEFYQ